MEAHGRTCRYVSSGQGAKTAIFLPGGFAGAGVWLRTIVVLEGRRPIGPVRAWELATLVPWRYVGRRILIHAECLTTP